MYLPEIYQAFSLKNPRPFSETTNNWASSCQAGPLDEKTQELVKLGYRHRHQFPRRRHASNTRKCLAAGSTPEEIIHVVLLALTTTGFPNMIAALRWVDTVLNRSGPEA